MGLLTAWLPLPAQAGLRVAGGVLKKVPREVWYILLALVLLFLADCNGERRANKACEQANAKARHEAQVAAITQEAAAPKIVASVEAKIEPKVRERVKRIENEVSNSGMCDVIYSDGVQREIREAAAAADRM